MMMSRMHTKKDIDRSQEKQWQNEEKNQNVYCEISRGLIRLKFCQYTHRGNLGWISMSFRR
jgi:hypothetical protein